MQFKHLLLASFLLASVSVSSQIYKGAVFIGGNLSFSREESNQFVRQINRFIFSPSAGIAIKENLVTGVDLTYSGFRSWNADSTFINVNSKTYGGGIFLRSYKVVAKNLYLFGQARVGTSIEHEEQTSNTDLRRSETYRINLTIYPGIAYQITKKLQLEAGFPELLRLGYTSIMTTYNPGVEPTRTRGFEASTSLTNGTPLSIGIRLLINGKINN